jgi:D-lactate dehydrogenase
MRAMRVGVFSAKGYDRASLGAANARAGAAHELVFLEARLTRETAPLGAHFPAVCAFANDRLDADVLSVLAGGQTRLVALRSAGFNNVDVEAARRLGLAVARVPAYSPHAVAEHTIALILTLARKLHRALDRVREGNFSLEGLLGSELHGRTVGIVGTGKIGATVARALSGFGVTLLGTDVRPSPECAALGLRYVPLDELLRASDVVTLHCPLTAESRHLIDGPHLGLMRPGALLVNTGRGALVDTAAVVEALKHRRLGGVAIDVYEEEEGLFFEDHSADILEDDTFARLLTFPNVVVTGHQAFFTENALADIARTTIENLTAFERGEPLANAVAPVG